MEYNLEKQVHIGELYDLNHRNDKELHSATQYKINILEKVLSKNLYKNDKTAGFLEYLQTMVIHMITSNVITRNWMNFNVSKYYDRHSN